MAQINKPTEPVFTHEGAKAQKVSPYTELRRTVMTCMLWENTFYETGNDIAARIAELIPKVHPKQVADLAIEARDKMYLRHVPLFMLRELARIKGCGTLVECALDHVIQRADELSEFVALYWKDKKQPLSAGVKRGLASAFTKFNEYSLAKYNSDKAIKLRDVLFMCHAKPKDSEQAATWKKLIANELSIPDTWETELSAGKDKKATFERLISEGKLGGLATLRNLRNMEQANVDSDIVKDRLKNGEFRKVLPFRFVTAARYAPTYEPELEVGMLQGCADIPMLAGKTGLLVDVSGSMDYALNRNLDFRRLESNPTNRIDVAAGLAILLREKCPDFQVATFSLKTVVVPPRRGFALRDAIVNSQEHNATYLKRSLISLAPQWAKLDRVIVITDEQSQDGIMAALWPKSYVVNVAPNQYGLSYGDGWTHIDGWSERVLDYILAVENDAQENS